MLQYEAASILPLLRPVILRILKNYLLDIDSFKNIMKSEDLVKLVIIITVDGGPDENPR